MITCAVFSRFGKFVEIQFDKYGKISGAAIRTYLLERSRVCQVSDPERSYHCFYMLCAAPPEVRTIANLCSFQCTSVSTSVIAILLVPDSSLIDVNIPRRLTQQWLPLEYCIALILMPISGYWCMRCISVVTHDLCFNSFLWYHVHNFLPSLQFYRDTEVWSGTPIALSMNMYRNVKSYFCSLISVHLHLCTKSS